MRDEAISGLGGWLALLGLGLFLTPLRALLVLSRDLFPIFSKGYWAVLTTPGTEAYHALWGPLIVFEVVTNMGFAVAALVGLTLFNRRSPSFPRFMLVYFLANAALVSLDFFASAAIPAVQALGANPANTGLVQGIASAAIWVPYLLVSKRVKNTFRPAPPKLAAV